MATLFNFNNFTAFLNIRPKLQWALRMFCLFLLIVGALVALSTKSLPIADIAMGDKILHASAFFGFALLFHLAWSRSFWLTVFVPLLSYGILIELMQGMTTWRSMTFGDVVADAVGILLYWLLHKWLLQPHSSITSAI